jgi:hypothetical protein
MLGTINNGSDYRLRWRVAKVTGPQIVWQPPVLVSDHAGRDPSIGLTTDNRFVEVHEGPGRGEIEFLRGHVKDGVLTIGGHDTISTDGKRPTVAVNDAGRVVVAYGRAGPHVVAGAV